MTGLLLDTNILSELRRPRPEPKVVAFISGQPAASLYISIVTLAEVRFGIEMVGDAAKRAELNEWLTQTVRPMFDRRILPLSEDIVLKWRLLVEEGHKARHTYSQPDLFIAATALVHGMTLVSRNAGDFEKTRLDVVNPWTV